MIDILTHIAKALQFLRLPAVAIGLLCLAIMTTIIIRSNSHEGDLYLIPSVVGILWSVTTYGFLVNFHSVPHKADRSWRFFRRLKRNIARAGYWLMGVLFIGTTLGALLVSYRLIRIWLKDYGGYS
jgi:fatty acid desaturase